MHRNRLAAIAVAVALLPAVASAEPPRFLLEFGAGPNIPLTRYFDVGVEDGFVEVDNSAHAALQVAMVIKGFTLRYGANMVHLGEARQQMPTSSRTKLNYVLVDGLGGQPIPAQSIDQVNDEIIFHNITVGYRFYLTDGRWQPYIPLEGGVVVVSGDPLEDKDLYGLTAATGFGLDVQVFKALHLGLVVRYNFVLTEAVPDTALIGFTSDSPAFEHAIAMAHLLSITLQTQVRF